MFHRRLPASSLAAALGLTLLTAGICIAADTAKPWFERHLVGMEVGPTGAQFSGHISDPRYASRFDGRDIVRRVHAAHGEYLVIWARDGDFAYYDSKLQPKCPGLGSRDVLREAVEEGRRIGMPIISYCVQQYPAHALREHPEWRMVDADGKPIDGRVCYRSGYREYMKQMLTEQLAYGIDGFHLDMVDQGFGPPHGCWCATCRKEFEAQHGHPMPKGPTWDDAWDRMLEFRYESSDAFEKELTSHVRQLNPRATVDFNYHGNPPFSWEVGQLPVRHALNGDFVTGETGVWGFSALTVGLNAEFYRGATPGKPVQVAMQRGVRMYHDQTTRPLADMRWELLNLLAHGSFVTMVDKTGYDGWLDPLAYERFGELFREARAKRAHFGHAPVQDVGILFGSRTRDWVGRDKPMSWYPAFLGAHKAMVYEHLPWGVLHEEDLSAESLRRFRVVLLPNVSILSDAHVALLRAYVEQGGCILATGRTGTHDRMGREQPSAAWQAMAGVRHVRTLDSTDNWIRFTKNTGPAASLVPDGRTNWPFLVRGPALVLEPAGGSPIGELLQPHRTPLHAQKRYNEDWPLSPDSPVGPAAVLHTVGQGRILTLAASPDWSTASDHHISETRRLLANAVRMLTPDPRVRVTAPSTVETVITDDPKARVLRVHFLGYNAPPQTLPAKERPYVLPVPIEDAPMFQARIELQRRPKSATSFSKATRLQRSGAAFDLTIHDIHEVISIRY